MDDLMYTKNQLYTMKKSELAEMAIGMGLSVAPDAKEKELVDAIYAGQQAEWEAGGGTETEFSELAKLDPSTKIEVTVGLLLAMASQIATDVVNTAYATFEANNAEALAQARSLGERIDGLTREVQDIRISMKARESLHGTIDQLGKIK